MDNGRRRPRTHRRWVGRGFWQAVLLGAGAALATVLTPAALAGPRGTLVVRPLGNLKLTIDGDLEDWPLDQFGNAAEQPLFPEVRDRGSSSALGDHLVFDPRRIGRFNDTPETAFSAGDHLFGSSLYFAYDAQFLYILGVFIDDVLRDDRDDSDTGGQPYFNDGWEMLLGLKGDTTGCRPTGQDIQLGFALNKNFKPQGAPDDVLGARQVLLVGTADQLGSGAGQPDNAYQAALDAIGGPNIAARKYADLRAAGARNPEILANPDTKYSGYVIEVRIPFGKAGQPLSDFTPDHPMGFEMWWRNADQDDDPNAGRINVKWASWAQNTTDACNDDTLKISLLNTSNWGRLIFDKSNFLGPAPTAGP